MDPKKIFQGAVSQASGLIKHLQTSRLSLPTPCPEWDLKALLNHLTYEVLWVPELVAGKTIAEIGDKYDGNVLGEDAQGIWQTASSKALKAVEGANLNQIAHLSYADVPVGHYVAEVGTDVFIHAWDVAQAIYSTLIFDPTIAQAIYDNNISRRQEMADSGAFGMPITIAADANIQTKLLALFGRKNIEGKL